MQKTFLSPFQIGYLVLLLAAGCTHTVYRVGGEKFSSSDKALQRIREVYAAGLEKVAPTSQPVHGRALVLLPSWDVIQRSYMTNPAALGEEKERFEYTKATILDTLQFYVDSIKKRVIFDSVTVAYHDGTPAMSSLGDYDWLIYLDVDGWFIRGKQDKRDGQIAESLFKRKQDKRDHQIADEHPRQSFLDSLEQLARKQSANNQ